MMRKGLVLLLAIVQLVVALTAVSHSAAALPGDHTAALACATGSLACATAAMPYYTLSKPRHSLGVPARGQCILSMHLVL